MRLAPKSLTKSGQPREFFRRVDKIAGDLNVVLFIFMIGLATLDFTFLLTQKVVEALPPATRIVHDQSDSIFNQQPQAPATQPTK